MNPFNKHRNINKECKPTLFFLLPCLKFLPSMRIIAELPHPDFKITMFHWNNRYLIKIEQGYLEQTYKIDQFEVAEDDLKKVLDEPFLKQVTERFSEMYRSFHEALQRVENQMN